MTDLAKKPRIYIAGPVGPEQGREDRVRTAMDVFDLIIDMGLHPFCPHLYFYIDKRNPRIYEEWMALCVQELSYSDALFRMHGDSPGADREVEIAMELGIPIFHNFLSLRKWDDRVHGIEVR